MLSRARPKNLPDIFTEVLLAFRWYLTDKMVGFVVEQKTVKLDDCLRKNDQKQNDAQQTEQKF